MTCERNGFAYQDTSSCNCGCKYKDEVVITPNQDNNCNYVPYLGTFIVGSLISGPLTGGLLAGGYYLYKNWKN